jgi:hypothetical protein
MVVHSDQTRDHGAPGKIDCARSGRNRDGPGLANLANHTVFDEDRLVRGGGSCGAIDDAHVLEGNDGRVHGDEALGHLGKGELLLSPHCDVGKAQDGRSTQNFAHSLPFHTKGSEMIPLPVERISLVERNGH